ncbi:hypothetical protein [Marmoricola sp. RAF53]|uniref:hypothetical protein n=1 Tax=Marmoricola sp. RAF53 TaxID=3233059 RepID=UPI003F9D8BF3
MVGCDKLVVTHLGALRRKYGTAGAARVRTALDALDAADRDRGLTSRLLLLDNASSAKALKVAKVADGDWAATVRTVDRAAAKYLPSYILLVGATDVVPQARLRNPLRGIDGDDDPYLPSDLPYACDIPDTWAGTSATLLDPSGLLSVTRVVGRLPDLVGATDPEFLLRLLDTATTYQQRASSTYQQVFSLTAAAWKGSTTLSVDLLPGPAPVTNLSPPRTTGWTRAELKARTHFVNCHGGDTTPDWFGQLDSNAPVDTVALSPEDVDGRITAGTVVAAECCYGAMHQDPADLGGRLPMMWAYLGSAAYAGVGSSTTAYGPADGNGQADLVCRFVLEGVIAGASTGRALLDARQRYLRELGALGPEDLKTLGQFDLLGDPSLQPVRVPGRPKQVVPKGGGPVAALTQRRAVLRAAGRALGATVPRSSSSPARRSEVSAEELAVEAGLRAGAATGTALTFTEGRRAPRAGYRFHVAPVRAAGRDGLVIAREADGQRQVSTIWRKG